MTTNMTRERSRRSNGPWDEEDKCPDWPGYNFFRMIMPSNKVQYLTEDQGAAMRTICDETRACVRLFLGHSDNSDHIVLIYGKDEPHDEFSPAMLAARRVFKCINHYKQERSHSHKDDRKRLVCSTKLLVDYDQVEFLIGGQIDILKSIEEKAEVYCKISSIDEAVPLFTTDSEQVIRIHGEFDKVLRAFLLLLGELRKFVVDKSVITLILDNYLEATSHYPPADDSGPSQTLDDSDFYWSRNRYYSRHGCDRDAGLGRSDYMIQTIKMALEYVDDIIGADGSKIAYIRRTSGAIINITECYPNKITVEIKGSLIQIERAEQLIQDFIGDFKAPAAPSTVAQPTLGSNLQSQYQSPETDFYRPPYQHSQYQSPNTNFYRSPYQHSQYQSPKTNFHRSPYQYSQYQSPKTNFHHSPYQHSQYQSPDTDFESSPPLSWYQNVSDRYRRYLDGRGKY